MSSLRLLLLGVLPVLAGCSERTARGPGLSVEVAPLTLTGVSDACYSIAIANEAGDPVVARSQICASDYGARGGISYVAPCDATDINGDDDAINTVTLTIDSILGPSGGLDYIDPCAAPHAPNGCVLNARCAENGDTPVRFDLTVMRQANQGFFDVAVTFDDIFCSAKVDCVDNDGPLELLHHPVSGVRAQTAVVALACTAGPDAVGTRLLRDPIKVTCGEVVTTLDPSRGPGNAYGNGPEQMVDPDPADAVWQYAVYAGDEALTCSGAPCRKRYWNVAIGFDPTVRNCRLETTASAVDGSLATGFATPLGAYPVIAYDVPLTTDSTSPTLACSRHPMNDTPIGVSTTYTALGATRAFFARYAGTLERSTCPEGWAGPTCATPVCAGCVHGTCSAPGECTCNSGWNGDACDEAICTEPCVNGSCTAPDECTCTTGWDGVLCDEAICTEPCVNGSCTAPDECACTNGWEGALCDEAICTEPCVNGTCTAPDECTCTTGWDGALCDEAVCTEPCVNGTCTAPDVCTCPPEWTGPTCGTPVEAQTVTAGLIMHLDAGDVGSYPGTGTAWNDLALNHDGTFYNGPTFRSAHEGGIVFNGTNQRIEVPHTAALAPTTATWEAWITPALLSDANHGDGIISKGISSDGNAANYELMLVPNGGRNQPMCRMNNGATRLYSPATQLLELGVPYQVVCTYDGSALRLYVNGVEVGPGLATTGNLTSSTEAMRLGKRAPYGDTYDSFFGGTLHVARVYGRGLSAAEVAQNFDALKDRFYDTSTPGLASGALIDLDASRSPSYEGVGLTWFDQSGFERDATLVNGPRYAWPDRALVLDGVDDRITTPGVSLSNNYSFELWFNPSQVNMATLIASPHYYAEGFDGNFIVRLTNATTLDFAVYNGRAQSEWLSASVPAVEVNAWHHLVLSNSNGVVSVYLDGVAIGALTFYVDLVPNGSMTFTLPLADSTHGLVLGDDVSWTNASLNGRIGALRVYDRPLSASEALQNFRNTRARYERQLAYDFAQKPVFFPLTTTRAVDLMGRTIDGTLVGAVAHSTLGGGSLAFAGGTARVALGNSLGNAFPRITVTAWVHQSTLISGYYTTQAVVSADDGSTSGHEGVFTLQFQHFDTTVNLPSAFVGRLVLFGVRSAGQPNRNRALTVADNDEWPLYLPGFAIGKNPAGLVAGEWVHLAGVYTGSESRVYVNGVLAGTSSAQPDGQSRNVSGPLNTSGIQRTIGAFAESSGAGVPGNIRGVRIYRAALSDAEIMSEFLELDGVLNP